MRLTDSRPALAPADTYPSVQPAPAQPSDAPPLGRVPFISLDAQQQARSLVRQADSDLACLLAATLMSRVISLEPGGQDSPSARQVDAIPADSTFGQAWSRLTQAVNSEPFATFAKEHHIDTSRFTFNPRSGWLDCTVNDKPATFTSYDSGWDQASADVLAAARVLAPTLAQSFEYAGEHSASSNVVSDFYGDSFANTKADTLTYIGRLQTEHGFAALVYPGSEQPRYNRPEHQHAKQLQRDAIDTVAARDQSPSLPQQSSLEKISAGDLFLARLCSSDLSSGHPETRLPGHGTSGGSIGRLPTFSTMGQTRQAFEQALNAEAFLRFAQQHKLDLPSVSIAPQTGDLVCQVTDPNGVMLEKRFTLSDDSGWSAVAADIVAQARDLAAGSTDRARHPHYNAVRFQDILNFYGETPADGTLLETLKRCAVLNRSGFPALSASSPTDTAPTRALQQKRRLAVERLDQATGATAAGPAKALNPTTETVRRQFDGQPDVRSVVQRLLTEAIQKVSPGLDFDINQIAYAEPDPANPGHFRRSSLTAVALNYLSGEDAPSFPDNSKLVDTRPDLLAHTGNTPDTPLPINLKAVEAALHALPTQLSEAMASDLRSYWAQPAFSTAAGPFAGDRQALVSELLRNNLRLAGLKQPGLDDAQRETLDQLVTRPPPAANSDITVFALGSVTRQHPDASETASPNLLVQRHIGERLILLLCAPNGTVTPYDSYAAFDAARAQHLSQQAPGTGRLNTLKKIDADPFVAQAQTLIEQGLGDVLSSSPAYGAVAGERPTRKMPGWVNNASEAERFVLHDLSLQLASIHQRNKGRTYNSDIPDIRPFAEQTFDNLKAVNHPAKDLQVVFKVAVGGTSPGGVISGGIHRESMSLTDALLRNLSGLPSRDVEVYLKPGNTRVTELEKDGVLQKLIEDADVGKKYPLLLKRELQDERTKKAERLALFAEQVPVELQIKALELAVNKQSGVDTTGLSYIQAILDPAPGTKRVDGQEIVIRPLAFVPGPGKSPDVVDNMYLIEPEDSAKGPHILYRPLIADAPLMQFPTRQALLQAIQQPGRLQKDILAWLPDDATRAYYKAWSFKEPSLQTTSIFGVGDGETVPAEPKLAAGGYEAANTLKEKLQTGQLMNHLYDANALGLTSIAEQQSVSDDESRWATLKEGGYLLLNAVLPALRGPGAAIGVALQFQGILSDLQTLADDDTGNKAPAMADLLVNLAMLLLQTPARPAARRVGAPVSASRNSIVEAPNGQKVRRLQVMKGTMEKMQLVKGNLFTFEDQYKGKPRLNINAHGRDLSVTERLTGASSTILYDGAEHTPEQLHAHLLAKGIDPSQFDNVRLLVCYSGNGAENSFAAQFQRLINKPVKAFVGTVTVTPSPELVTAEFKTGIQMHGPHDGPKLVSDTYAQYDSVETVKDRTDISMIRNPLEYLLFSYYPVHYPPRAANR